MATPSFIPIHSRPRIQVLRILFWNLNKKDRCFQVCETAKAMTCDIVMLIESANPFDQTLNMLRTEVSTSFHYPH